MPTDSLLQIAVLDDFQGVALELGEWHRLSGRAEVTVFRDHLDDPAALILRLKPFDVVCLVRERTPLPRAVIEHLPKLKLIASTGRRNPSIDLAAAHERGIVVCNTGSAGHGAAELTWALILGLIRNLPAEAASLRGGGWQTSLGGDLDGRTMGVVGLGGLGTRVARVAQAFGMTVIAWSQNLTAEKAAAAGARLVGKDELFATADVVSVHLVLSLRTKGLIGPHELGLMKPTAYFVNTSRGPLVDEAALIDVLARRAIAGAALDVFEVEPLPSGHPFRTLDNLLATPHVGFVTRDTYRIFYRDTVENILAWLDGKPIRVAGL
jgi:phosphoglycerate dehydrogenase-like enzyme